MRKLATTVRGLVGTDWVRLTLARLENGNVVFVRADGSDAVLPVLPTTYRTDADISTQAAKLGHRVDMAAVPSVGLKNHEWKGTYTLAEMADHPYQGKALRPVLDALKASYIDSIEQKAA